MYAHHGDGIDLSLAPAGLEVGQRFRPDVRQTTFVDGQVFDDGATPGEFFGQKFAPGRAANDAHTFACDVLKSGFRKKMLAVVAAGRLDVDDAAGRLDGFRRGWTDYGDLAAIGVLDAIFHSIAADENDDVRLAHFSCLLVHDIVV